jgi:hypothetical protein
MSNLKGLSIYDALYGDICLGEAISDLVRRPLVQRLRQIRLSNIDSLDMPGIANISRFEHALGTAYLASQVQFAAELSSMDRIALEAAALIHDTAITPFGHLTEEASQYLGHDTDHETKWSVLLAQDDPRETGGIDKQILLGRTAGLREWADKTFKGSGPEMLGRIVDAIKGKGILGPCICGTLDLDNLDNLVRIAFHMGLKPDPMLPVKIAGAMREISQSEEIVFRREALPWIGEWIELRERVYTRLMPSRLDFCGKLMLIYATVTALRSGVLGEADWHLTDSEFIDRLIHADNPDVRDTTKRWLRGEPWELSELMWMRDRLPHFTVMEGFATKVSEVLGGRSCFAYRIKDKRRRKVTAVMESGDRINVGERSDQWLLGIGSPKRESFTREDGRRISALATEFFSTDRVETTSAEAVLF